MSDPQQPAGLAVVIDTNFLLAHLPWLSLMSKAANQFQITLIVPWVVITELDSLKGRLRTNQDGLDVGAAARAAVRFLHRVLPAPFSPFRGQTLEEASQPEGDPSLVLNNDDRVLHCCLQVARQYGAARCLLLSNDKGLCVKGIMNKLLTAGWDSLPPLLLHCALHAQQAPDAMEVEALEEKGDPVGWLPTHTQGGSVAALEQAHTVSALLAQLRQTPSPPQGTAAHGGAARGGGAGEREGGKGEGEEWKAGEEREVVAREHVQLPEAYSEAWAVLRGVLEPLGGVLAQELEAAFGAEWPEAAGASPPWEVGDTLHVLRKHWHVLLQQRWQGLSVRYLARIQDCVRVLRRRGTASLSVGQALDLVFSLRALASAANVLHHCGEQLEEARRFLAAKALLLPLPDPKPHPHPHAPSHVVPSHVPAAAGSTTPGGHVPSAQAPSSHVPIAAEPGGHVPASQPALARVTVALPGAAASQLQVGGHGVGPGPGLGGSGTGTQAGTAPPQPQPMPSPTAMMCD